MVARYPSVIANLFSLMCFFSISFDYCRASTALIEPVFFSVVCCFMIINNVMNLLF